MSHRVKFSSPVSSDRIVAPALRASQARSSSDQALLLHSRQTPFHRVGCLQALQSDREMLGRVVRCLIADQGGAQLGNARPPRLVIEVGREVPGLGFGCTNE